MTTAYQSGAFQENAFQIDAALGTITGTLAATESADTFAGTGDVIVKGSLAVTETGSDTFASTGKVIVKGTLAVTESGSDTFAATGSVASTVATGTLAATETGSDTFASTGDVIVRGSLVTTESADVFASSGDIIVQGSFAATESADVFADIPYYEPGYVIDGYTASGLVYWEYPPPNLVALGTKYGPNGIYTGTMTGGGATSTLKYWDGSQWVIKGLRTWNGSAWI